jgi:hypothetical protein
MPRNGAGTYSLPPNTWNPAVTGTAIESSSNNATMNDLAAAMTQSISKDGQTPYTGNQPMGNNKLTGLADGAAAGDSATFGQTLHASGGNVISGNQDIIGAVSISGSLSVSGPVIFTNGLAVGGTTTLSGNVVQAGAYSLSGDFEARSASTGATSGGRSIGTYRANVGSAGDQLGTFYHAGQNDSGAKVIYASIGGEIVTATSGNEAGAGRLRSVLSGSLGTRFRWGAGIYAQGLTDPGLGKINASGFQINNVALTSATRFYGSYATNADITTVIPLDDTTPLIGEGTQIITINVITISATQRVRVGFVGFGGLNGTASIVAALFRASTCLNATVNTVSTSSWPAPMTMDFEEVPGSAGTFAYSIRVGPGAAGTMRMNGETTGRLFGGTAVSTLTADVWEP